MLRSMFYNLASVNEQTRDLIKFAFRKTMDGDIQLSSMRVSLLCPVFYISKT